MADIQRPQPASDHAKSPHGDATHEELPAAKLPVQETDQPDPMLQLSIGDLGAGAVTLAALAGAIVLGVVLYGLNSPPPNASHAGTPASAPSASPAGTSAAPPPH